MALSPNTIDKYSVRGLLRGDRSKSDPTLPNAARRALLRPQGTHRVYTGGYFQYSHWTSFKNLDGWTRMRLRSILRRRAGRTGRGYGYVDNRLWPNAFFAERGLFSLVTAHRLVRQPSLR